MKSYEIMLHFKKIVGSPVLWLCEMEGAQNMIFMKTKISQALEECRTMSSQHFDIA